MNLVFAAAQHVAARFVRSPAIWLCIAGLLALPVALTAWSPIGIGAARGEHRQLFYASIFLTLLVGAAFGAHVLEPLRTKRSSVAIARRLAFDALVITAAALILLVFSLVSWCVVRFDFSSIPARVVWIELPLIHLHLLALALLLLRCRLPMSVSPILLLLFAWLLPATASTRPFTAVVDVARQRVLESRSDFGWPASFEHIAPILVLLLLSLLVDVGVRRGP